MRDFFVVAVFVIIYRADAQHCAEKSVNRRDRGRDLFGKRPAPDGRQRGIERCTRGHDDDDQPLQNIIDLVIEFHLIFSFHLAKIASVLSIFITLFDSIVTILFTFA